MGKILGLFFVALPFIALFVYGYKRCGIRILIPFIITALTAGSIWLGCYLLVK